MECGRLRLLFLEQGSLPKLSVVLKRACGIVLRRFLFSVAH
jgi:hypothetical protein